MTNPSATLSPAPLDLINYEPTRLNQPANTDQQPADQMLRRLQLWNFSGNYQVTGNSILVTCELAESQQSYDTTKETCQMVLRYGGEWRTFLLVDHLPIHKKREQTK